MQLINFKQLRDNLTDETLAELLHDLIRGTVSFDQFSQFEFPTSNLSGAHGFDAKLQLPIDFNHPFLPNGYSCWELGVTTGVTTKANSDYNKRKQHPNAKETSFVFVTPQEFNKRKEWEESKREEQIWLKVKVLNGHSLVDWLQELPAVQAKWAAKWNLINSEDSVFSIENFWNNWNLACDERLPIKLVKALGQSERQTDEDQATLVEKWLISNNSSVLRIAAGSVDESRLYLAAVLLDINHSLQASLLSKIICTEDKTTFYKLAEHDKPLIIVTSLQDAGIRNLAQKNNHRVCLVLRSSNASREINIELPLRINQHLFFQALDKEGFTSEERAEWENKSGRSLSALRNALGQEPPLWTSDLQQLPLLSALLVGGWDSNKEEDRLALKELSTEKSYNSFEEKLIPILNIPQSPLQCESPYWRSISPYVAWIKVSEYLSEPLLNRFKQICISILGAQDAISMLSPEERSMADFKGVTNPYSKLIRRSLAESLILLSQTLEQPIKTIPNRYGRSFVPNLIEEILSAHSFNWKSVSQNLPELIEAAPNTVLDALERDIDNHWNKISYLATTNTNSFFTGGSLHTHILWALELVAWNDEHMAKASRILLKLEECWKDLADNAGNRPANSFADIFSYWLPQTNSSLKLRIKTLTQLSRQFPDTIWPILLKLLPTGYATMTHGARPKWRWEVLDTLQTQNEIYEFCHTVFYLALDLAKESEKPRLGLLRALSSHIPAEWRNDLYSLLAKYSPKSANRFQIWNELRATIHHNRSFADAEWALPENEILELLKIYKDISPKNIIKQNSWVFANTPKFFEGDLVGKRGYEKQQALGQKLQQKALAEIYNKNQEESLINLLKACPDSYNAGDEDSYPAPYTTGIQIGIFLTTKKGTDCLFEFISRALEKHITKPACSSLMSSLIKEMREDSLLSGYKKAKNSGKNFFLLYLLALPLSKDLLSKLSKESADIQNQYWELFSAYSVEPDLTQEVVNKLINSSRLVDAASIASRNSENLTFTDILHLLEQLASSPELNTNQKIRQYEIQQLFKFARGKKDVEPQLMANLEWLYFPFLKDVPDGVTVLFDQLTRTPEFFIELLSYAYKSKTKKQKSKIREDVALQAYRVIEAQKRAGGWLLTTFKSKNIDYSEELLKWINSVRKIAQKEGYVEVADSTIGQQLACSGKDPSDDAWPEIPVRKIFETITSEKMATGFLIGWSNKQGAFWGNAVDHYRKQKNDIKKNSKKIVGSYPNTLKLLQSLLERVEQDIEWAIERDNHNSVVS